MPNRVCDCGHLFRLGEIPSRDQWMIISDEAYDQFFGDVDAEKIYLAMKIMLKCPNCGCLWVYWDGFKEPPSVYRPDLQDKPV